MVTAICKLMLRLGKWECIGPAPIPVKNCIFLEAPHTSIWDFAIGYFYYRSHGGHLKTMIKKEAFFFPFGCILRALGAFPIDRKNSASTITSIIHEMNSSDKPFHLAICPEGTRKAVHKWKTGYHTIARQVGIPVYVTYVDWGHRKVGIVGEVELTDNARADTDRIQKIYEDLNLIPLHPENYATR